MSYCKVPPALSSPSAKDVGRKSQVEHRARLYFADFIVNRIAIIQAGQAVSSNITYFSLRGECVFLTR